MVTLLSLKQELSVFEVGKRGADSDMKADPNPNLCVCVDKASLITAGFKS